MCDNGFRNHGVRPMGENLRSKPSGQRRTIQSTRKHADGAANPPAAAAATPFFKGGGAAPPLKKGAANAVSGGFAPRATCSRTPWGHVLRAELWPDPSSLTPSLLRV